MTTPAPSVHARALRALGDVALRARERRYLGAAGALQLLDDMSPEQSTGAEDDDLHRAPWRAP